MHIFKTGSCKDVKLDIPNPVFFLSVVKFRIFTTSSFRDMNVVFGKLQDINLAIPLGFPSVPLSIIS